MIYDRWMSYIKDETHITKLAMPGAHNAGTKGMPFVACCQDGTLYEQYKYGVRHFCIRLTTNKKGRVLIAHGITKGMPFKQVLADMKRMVEEAPSEFFVFDIRAYPPQKIGPLKVSNYVEPSQIDELLAKYISPAENAFTEFDSIGEVTMGDIRRSGKRYIILNPEAEFAYSSDCTQLIPWDSKVYGYKVEKFVKSIYKFIDENPTDGFIWFQTQQTPGPGTENGIRKWPHGLDEDLRPYFPALIKGIADNEYYLKNVNIISGDFYTRDYMKVREILRLNLLKNAVIEDKRDEYERGLEA